MVASESARLGLLMVAAVGSGGGCDDGAAVLANPQTITFPAVLPPAADQNSLLVSATATSGLPVGYRSLTPTVCAVDADTGLVTALTSGTCTIAAHQSGEQGVVRAVVGGRFLRRRRWSIGRRG